MTGIALLIFIGGGTLMSYRGQGGKAAKDIAIWLAIMLVLVTAYTFRNDFELLGRRVAGELMPGIAHVGGNSATGERTVEIPRRTTGQYVTRVRINGTPIEMLVDTGATNVVLTKGDAERAGIDTTRLIYSVPVNTANGRALVASVKLRAVSVGDLGARNIQALVAQPEALDQSLLGMSFLSRLGSYEVRGGTLILRQ
jgi:aspartyl protease family protein